MIGWWLAYRAGRGAERRRQCGPRPRIRENDALMRGIAIFWFCLIVGALLTAL